MENGIKVLLLEDNTADAFLIERIMKKDGLVFESLIVDNRKEFSKGIKDFQPDIIISDHALPAFNSTEAFKDCKELGYNGPFILVTGTLSDEFAVSCLKSGVDDYILKSNLSRLPSAIRSAITKKSAEAEKLKRGEEIIRLNQELEMKIAERTKELIDAKYLSDSIVNSLPGIFYVLDRSMKIVKWNSNFAGTFGFHAATNKLHPLDTVQTGDRDLLTQIIERTFLVGNAISEINIVTKEKETVPYVIRSFRTQIDDQQLIFIIGFDISERKKTEEILRLNKERLELMVVQMEENAVLLKKSNEEAVHRNNLIEEEKKKSDNLLMSIFPESIAMELKEKGHAVARRFDVASILFADLVNFTLLSKGLTPEELSGELNWIFVGFDFIADRFNMERIKTIGDGYMAAGGVPIPNDNNPVDAINCGLQMVKFIERLSLENQKSGKPPWKVRIGIHTGEVIAGVIGKSKFSYDIWGTAVNTASRMEMASEPGKVNISGITYELVKEKFKCTPRGSIIVKNMGNMDMYFAESL
ncbi:MAG TPA: adenylate/guanylate cyclase domain-containing protein [Cyclobacteriaceae bacterium]|nr:adenylate/guanylate cyclase domain-containing protein [Cyclobacteriaceae bacterium]